MSQETMEGEAVVAVMEEKPSPCLGRFIVDSAAWLIDEAEESAWGNIPPEYISDGTIAMKSDVDVFSFGVLLLRMMSRMRGRVLNQHPNAWVYDTAEQDHGEVKFSMITASKGGFDIKIGSHTMHAPKYASARHPLVRMMLFAHNMLDDKFSCPKSMVPIRSILDMIRRSRSVSCCAGETPVESIGVYDESELGCTAIPSAIPPAIATKEDEHAAYHDDAMGGADTLSDMESIVAGFALAASPHEQNKIMNGWDNYTGYMDGVREVTHTKPEHHSIMEAAEKKTAATWVVATAAAHHATGNRDLLSDFTPDQPGRFVESADGAAPMQVLGHGSVITDTVVLPNVLYVPGLTANLVSASQLAELDYTVGFSRGACHIRSAADGTIVGKASVGGDGLFQLDFLQITGAIDKRPVI